MREIKEINLKKAILHILDTDELNYDESKACFRLDNDKLIKFLNKHILNSLHDEKTRMASFSGKTNAIKSYCNEIFSNEDNFVEYSQEIAHKLYTIMEGNRKISSADLIIVLFSSGSKDYLAILKMDYNEIFKHVADTTDDGKPFYDLVIDDSTSLPNLNQKLHKCAFVQPFRPEIENDLVLLDRQSSNKSANKDIAQFFLKSFLNAELNKDDKHKTRVFIDQTKKFTAENVEDYHERKNIISHMYTSLEQTEEINIKEFSKIYKKDLREKYMGNLFDEKLGDYEFKPDDEIVKKNNKKIKFETIEGVEIKLSNELIEQNYVETPKEKDDQDRNKIIIYTDGDIDIK